MDPFTRVYINKILDVLEEMTIELDQEATLIHKAYSLKIAMLRTILGDWLSVYDLPKDKLPAFLVDPDPEIREIAKIRMEALNDSTDSD